MQLSFNFSFDSEPSQSTIDTALGKAKNAVVEIADAQKSEPTSAISDEVSDMAVSVEATEPTIQDVVAQPDTEPLDKSSVPQYYDIKAQTILIKFEDLDLNTTLILDRTKNGFKLLPLSKAAGTKLMLAERRFETSEDCKLSRVLSYAVLANINIPFDEKHPIVGLFAQYGLNIILSCPGLAGLQRIRKEFNRIMVPFKFHVPPQFKDLQGQDSDFVTGPFVTDLYGQEITRYSKLLDKLGLVNANDAFHLYPYQAEDVAQLAVKRYAFINHDMGLGKTLIASALLQMHGYERVLVIAPAPAIGSWQSGWRHELLRMGIPKENIHVIEGPEDLPDDTMEPKRTESFKPFQNKTHVYLIDYNTLAKDKWLYASYSCPSCGVPVDSKMQAKCEACKSKLDTCPTCYNNQYGKSNFDSKTIKENWTGRYCNTCGFTIKKRVPTQGRTAKAELIMSHILKRKTYGKIKHLTEEQHKAVDDLPIHEKIAGVTGIANAMTMRQIHGYLSPKPVWKHIYPGMFKFLLMDESHMVKDSSTRRGNAVQMIRGLKRVYVMTGTMLTNYVSDSFWQLQRLFPGGLFPVGRQLLDFSAYKGMKKGEELFLNKFEGRSYRGKGHRISTIEKPEDFWGLMARVQLRRHDDDVEVNNQVHLPEIHFNTEFIEMDPYHRDLYRMKTGDFQKDIRKKIAAIKGETYANKIDVADLAPLNPADLRTKLQDLRQIAACPDQTGLYQNKDGSFRMTTKDARILELALNATTNKEKTVVFCSWVAQITRLKMFLEAQGLNVMVLDGRTSKFDKWEKIDTWRTDPNPTVLLASIEAMGQAINLTSLLPDEFKCRQVIFGSPEWAPNKMEQAWCRLYRIGQMDDTNVYFLYHKDTIEEEMDAMLYQKRITIAKAQDRVEINREDIQSVLTYQEIASRIINKFNQENSNV